MPRPSRQQIVGAEVPVQQRPAAVTDIVASPVNTMVAPEEGELGQLAKALASVHEPLARLHAQQDAQARQDAILAGRAQSEAEPDPAKADGAELAMGNVPSAYRRDAMRAYSEGIGQRLGINAKNDFLDAYAQESKKPDFSFDAFAADFRAKHLAGLGAPELIIGAAKHIDEGIALARGNYRQLQQERLKQDSDSTLSAQFSEISPTRDPESNASAARAAIDAYVQRGGTRAEGADFLLQHLVGLSTRFGGRSELFDIFDSIDPATGKTIAQLNPKLADNIQKARITADHQLEKTLFEEGLQTRSLTRLDLENGLAAGRFDTMTDEQIRSALLPHVGKQGIFNSDGEMASFAHKIYERQAKLSLRMQQRSLVTARQAFTLPAGTQHELLAEAAGGNLETVLAGLNDPSKADAVNAGLRAIVDKTISGGFDVALPALKSMMGSLSKEIPDVKSTTPPKFVAAARFYQDLKASNNPRLVAEYFDEDMRHVMDSYLRDTAQGQIASDTAYVQAYRLLSPEARKRAEDLMKDPTTAKKVRDSSREAVVGFFRRHAPWGNALGLAPDTSLLEHAAQAEMQRAFARDPSMSAEDGADYIAKWAQGNTYHDTATNTVIEVPQAMNSPAAQEALTEWLGMVKKAWSKGDNKVTPRLLHKGSGLYALDLKSSSGGIQTQGDVDLRDIVAVYQAKKNIQGAEFQRLGELRSKIQDGTLTPQDAADNAALIQKATDLGVFSGDVAATAFRLRHQFEQADVKPQLDKAVSNADKYRVSPSAPLRDTDANSLPVAQQFLARGDYAGALTAMSERVRLVAYKDPAHGMNIGLGYNMTVNAKNLPEDFRKAGIPIEFIDEIKAGKRAITSEQAVRLYDAVRPRYEKIASDAVGSSDWKKLPANARAVLTDLAYQTGNVKQFEQGLARLKEGDFSGAGLTVSFVQRETNQRRVDERRHALRVAMLKNVPTFQTLLSHAAKQPASQLEARLARADTSP